jgi:acyl-homoserine lactone acylase PvdQ
MRAPLLAAIAAVMLVPATATAATTLEISPSGQHEPGVSWASAPGMLPADTQALMYDRLTPRFRDIGPEQLQPSFDGKGYFRTAALLPADDPSLITDDTVSGSTSRGRVSARIRRDAYGVPHVFSDTDAGVTFGAGWSVAQDRPLLLNQARENGLVALLDAPGLSAINLIAGLYAFEPSAKVARRLERRQTAAIRAAGKPGRLLLRDIDNYIAGMNAYFAASKPDTRPFTRLDIYALNGVKSQFLGEGGGAEVRNAELLDTLEQELGGRRGSRAYADFRSRNDPEAAVTTTRSFPYQNEASVRRGRGAVRLRAGTFESATPDLPGDGVGASAAISSEHEASNVLIASGKASATGTPALVGGPQISYFYPGLVGNIQLTGPNLAFRGITSAPFPGYGLIGRGNDSAWTLTSAGVDIVDTYAERLCGGSRTRYLFKGDCRRMKTVNAGTISKGGETVRVRYRETVHGPVWGYSRTRKGNRLVALTRKRSSRGRETLDQLFFRSLSYGKVRSARDFAKAASRTPQTFNSFYASATEAAFFTSGAFPKRRKGVNPDLPVDGSGRHEWRGELPARKHPQVINPDSGLIVNWNNKPARNFPAADNRFGNEVPNQRVKLLDLEAARRAKHDPASLLAAANAAATQDLREVTLWPVIKRVLDRTPAPTANAQVGYDRLAGWAANGGSRVDADLDGQIDSAGAVVLDRAWEAMTEAALCKRLGAVACEALDARVRRFSAPPDGQNSGWYGFLYKDLRTLLGDDVRGRYGMRYCGEGDLDQCSRDLWAALDGAVSGIVAEDGADPAGWTRPVSTVQFIPLPLERIQYTNRPSGTHLVMQFDR